MTQQKGVLHLDIMDICLSILTWPSGWVTKIKIFLRNTLLAIEWKNLQSHYLEAGTIKIQADTAHRSFLASCLNLCDAFFFCRKRVIRLMMNSAENRWAEVQDFPWKDYHSLSFCERLSSSVKDYHPLPLCDAKDPLYHSKWGLSVDARERRPISGSFQPGNIQGMT